MSPEMFVSSPSLWIKALSKFKGTFCMVPNYALDLAANVEVPADIDLSSLHTLGNGSESVSFDTMKYFYLKFAPQGLREHALRAFYGLSEHTAHLCASGAEDLIVKRGHVVTGRPHVSVTVRMVDPKTHREVAEGEEGEVWIHSESKAVGYWGREELSKEVFHAELVGDKEKTYLRTGDMGFVDSGNLFIVGKFQDLIVISGQKVYLNEIEMSLEGKFSELHSGRTAAVEWDSSLALTPLPAYSRSPTQFQAPRRGVGFFAELQNEDYLQAADCHMLAEKIAAQIGLEFRVETLLVALLPLRTMPHTGSGKRQQSLCKANLLSGTLQVIYQWSPSTILPGRDGGTMVKHKFFPLPPTPIPQTKKKNAAKSGNKSQPLPKVQPSPPKQLSPVHSPTDTVPVLTLDSSPISDSSPTSEEVAEIPRKGSRFCLEDAPPALQETGARPLKALTEGPHSGAVDYLEAPDAGRREQSKRLIGQEKAVMDIIGRVLGVAMEMDTNIWTHGCNSMKANQISSQLEQHLGFSVEAHLLFAYQTPRALLEKLKRTLLHLCSPVSADPTSYRTGPPTHSVACGRSLLPSRDDIAIVSMACRFPGCNSPEELWEMLTEKTVSISHFQEPESGRWIHGSFTDRMACFDHKWFGISKMEASKMDPQQSILLHTAWECLQQAGYASPDEVKGSKIGVFIGFWGSDARALNLSSESRPPCTSYIGALTANRISYVFDLKGPSMAVDTACAASLTALEVAFNYIHQGKCSQALVGGVNALLDPKIFEVSSNMGMLSLSGESRVFDVKSSGYVRGEGCGMVMVKRVREAVKHNDRILAVVKSVETLHNGEAATLTAPSTRAQSRLLRTSLSNAMMGPSDVSYMEAHGTGTPLGDPMEINAIREVFGATDAKGLPRVGPLIVGSIKGNIGHLEAGAGMAGLIKAVLVLEHAKAPGIAGLETINPSLKIDPDQILLPQEMVSLDTHYLYRPENPNLLSAGVNCFGIGGAIANAVLQQFSRLPHLGQVQCSLILGGELDNVTMDQVMGAIQLLRVRLREFDSAYLSCVEAFQRAVKPVKILTNEAYFYHPAYLVFCLLYSTVQTLVAHNVEISFVMGTNLCAEVVVLAVTEVLILSDAMRLLLAGMAPRVFNIKFITEEEMQPKTSFLSPALNQLCLPGRFPPSSLNHLMQEVQRTNLMQSTCSNPALAANLVSLANSGFGPLLGITLCPESPAMRAVSNCSKKSALLQLQSPGLMDHLRETCLQLRRTSDDMAYEESENPLADVLMPAFYERFPMRAVQRDTMHLREGQVRRGSTGGGDGKFHPMKPKQRLSCADESGYITQTASAESLKNSTPAISPVKPHPPLPTGLKHESHTTTAAMSEEAIINSTPAISPVKPRPPLPTEPVKHEMHTTTAAVSEEAIINGIVDLIRNELVADLDRTNEEASEIPLLALGLESISLIELQDHLLESWKVDIPLARITELGTVRAIAAEVVKMSEQASTATNTDKSHSECGHYYTVPSLKDLGRYSKDELKCVENFTVGRSGYGKAEFLGKTDISRLDLQRQLVNIEHCSISLCEGSKSSLNRPALLYYENAFSPPPTQAASTVDDPVGELLKSLNVSAHLIHSNPDDGQLVIKVDSFY